MISFVINISLSLAKLTRSIFASRNPPSTFWFLDCGKISISVFPIKGFLHSPKGFHIPAQCILDSPVVVTISSPSGFRISPLGDGIPPQWISDSHWGDSSFLLRGFQVPVREFQVSLGDYEFQILEPFQSSLLRDPQGKLFWILESGFLYTKQDAWYLIFKTWIHLWIVKTFVIVTIR